MEKHNRVLAVFAHPDDEAFGPGGTLAVLAQETEVTLLCVTDGGAANESPDLARVRREELLASAKILGLKEVRFLDYRDGSLCNTLYHQVAADIQKVVDELQPTRLITFEPKGVSGHLDHVAISLITSYVFRENKQIKELWYFCELENRLLRPFREKYFIYFPLGYAKETIDKEIDTSGVYSTQVKAMMAHRSQRKDALQIIASRALLPKREYFLVKKR